MRKIHLSTLVASVAFGLLFSGCAAHKVAPVKVEKPVNLLKMAQTSEICSKLKKPAYLSFKQTAFAVAKAEDVRIGEIYDYYFYDRKFHSSKYTSIPQFKLDLEAKHQVAMDIENYATSNRSVNITAKKKDLEQWFSKMGSKSVGIAPGIYPLSQIAPSVENFIPVSFDSTFDSINVRINYGKMDALMLLNIITKSIASIASYDYKLEDNKLHIMSASSALSVKDNFTEPFVEFLEREHIYYQKNDNAFVIKDSVYKLWSSKMFLRSLNLAEDRFTFCVHIGGDDIYGDFTGNEKIVLKDIGKIQLIDYGMVHEGKLKYKLKIENSEKTSVEEYTIYSAQDTFSTQLDSKAVIKIKLY
jgi:uncharacterized protein YcfL